MPGAPVVLGVSKTVDKMAETGLYSDGAKGLLHPTTPELRINDQELDGVDAEVIYGILGVGGGHHLDIEREKGIRDPELLTAVYDMYNEWLADFCKGNPQRFAGLACIVNNNPDVAAGQLRRAAELGLKGAEFNAANASKPIFQKEWDVLWATAAEYDMPISFHTLGMRLRAPEGPDKEEYRPVQVISGATLFQMAGVEFLTHIIFSGACDRHPDFKFVLGECGIGWIPYVLERLDDVYGDRHQWFNLATLSMNPSELWHRQGHSTFQDDFAGGQMIHLIGEENAIWGSDYPHPDGVWPQSQAIIQKDLGHLEEKVRRKIVCENAARLYKLN